MKDFLKYYDEIKCVGIKNWLWFVFYLKRDEFSLKLRLSKYYYKYGKKKYLNKLNKDRQRAHYINLLLKK